MPTVLLFHDSGYSSNAWLKLGLLHDLNINGFRAVVIDLPGHGGSDKAEPIKDQKEKGNILSSFLYVTFITVVSFIHGLTERFQLNNYVAVVPGISGQYFLPYLFDNNGQVSQTRNLAGLVTISPGISLLYIRNITISKNWRNTTYLNCLKTRLECILIRTSKD